MKKTLASPLTIKFTFEGGWQFHFRIEQDKSRVTVTTELLRNGRAATKREAALWRDVMPVCAALLVKELSSAAGEDKVATKMAKWLDQYRRASLCRSPDNSPQREEGIRFLTSWRRETVAVQETGQKIPKLNAEFFKGMAESMEILSDRIYNSKDGSGENLDRWLLDYKLRLPDLNRAEHTVRELNEQLVSKFRAISDKKLREKCRKLNVPLKHDVRGAGAVRRKRSNGTPRNKKRANRSD